jgi:hypothetical protein
MPLTAGRYGNHAATWVDLVEQFGYLSMADGRPAVKPLVGVVDRRQLNSLTI